MEQQITYKGLRNLDSFDISKIQTLVDKNFPKIQRNFSNAHLTVDIKKAAIRGKRARYTVILRVSAPTKVILTAKHTDWELERAVHRAFDNIKSESSHKFGIGVVRRIKKVFHDFP